MEEIKVNTGSFRDPSGFIFQLKDRLYRCINLEYKEQYEHLISSGLYQSLVQYKLLVEHKEEKSKISVSKNQYKIIEPKIIEQISYPYEWSFSQLKEAALTTLDIQLEAVKFDMMLKDATPYNIQFEGTAPIFIDTLSFEKVVDNDYLWKPYKQFCEMFLHPLCVSAYVDPQLSKMLMTGGINGISSNHMLRLLSIKHKFNFSVFLHIILPHYFSNKKNKSNGGQKKLVISKEQHLRLVNQLKSFIEGLKLDNKKTQWGQYYDQVKDEKNDYLLDKKKSIEHMISNKDLNVVWDLGANDGLFSRLMPANSYVFSLDFDWKSVEFNVNYNKKLNITNILPLCVDLINPSPGIGWLNQERPEVFKRLKEPDLVMGLALIHHLLHFNISLNKIVELFEHTKKYLIVEYVPFHDNKAEEIFESVKYSFNYPTLEEFKNSFQEKFDLLEEKQLAQTDRTLLFYAKK